MKLFRCEVEWGEMDMSGGDNVDGPRFTGEYIRTTSDVWIGADSAELAEAAALELFYEHQKATVVTVTLESENLVVVSMNEKARR